MMAVIPITPWHWAGFILFILFFLALDLGVFHRGPQVISLRVAFRWSVFWCTMAMVFAGALILWRSREEGTEFVTGYLIELSLSMDNVFIMALIFSYFQVEARFQHRILFWGILGALLMRGIMIAGGAELIEHFAWTLYLFGAFLVYTGIKMMFVHDEKVAPDKNPMIRLARKIFPVTEGTHEGKLIVTVNGRRMLTTLMLVLLMVETTDLVFALDSVPAVFSVTREPFIVFTSNVFAILGLRSLYFVLAGAIRYFRYLKVGLAIVLVFVGTKMLLAPHDNTPRWFQIEIPTWISLAAIAVVLGVAMLCSAVAANREKNAGR